MRTTISITIFMLAASKAAMELRDFIVLDGMNVPARSARKSMATHMRRATEPDDLELVMATRPELAKHMIM